MTTLTIKEAVLLEDYDPNGTKLYWAEATMKLQNKNKKMHEELVC